MTTTNQMTTALLTEHFRYTPLTLLDDIINTVNELVFRAINAIEEGLNSASAESLGFHSTTSNNLSPEARQDALQEAKQNEIDNGIVQLETLLNATVDKDFDKFEIYTLRNILAVGHEEEELAQWVRLQHYKNLDLDKSGGQNGPTPEEAQLQRRKLHETAKLNALLKAEEARNEAVLTQLRTQLGISGDAATSPFGFLAPSVQTSRESTVHQNIQYALSQLPALRQLIAQLKDALKTLPAARNATVDPESVEAKRTDYVQSRSRRALERRGIESNAPAVDTGDTRRKISRDDVAGMEAVVQALGGASRSRRAEGEMEE